MTLGVQKRRSRSWTRRSVPMHDMCHRIQMAGPHEAQHCCPIRFHLSTTSWNRTITSCTLQRRQTGHDMTSFGSPFSTNKLSRTPVWHCQIKRHPKISRNSGNLSRGSNFSGLRNCPTVRYLLQLQTSSLVSALFSCKSHPVFRTWNPLLPEVN
ncbi:hypothetical protein VTK56DRAFT_4499 [Thermocarpiscus australiensis]